MTPTNNSNTAATSIANSEAPDANVIVLTKDDFGRKGDVAPQREVPKSQAEIDAILAQSRALAPKLPPLPLPYRFAKRAFDVVGSAAGLVVLSPVLLGAAVAVRATSPGPVIMRQWRYGKDSKPFKCYKFRTMKQDTPKDVPTSVMRENPDVMTPVGPFLRKASIDELPQFVNILKGDMSAVGPRPMILAEYEQIVARDRYGANGIKPGIAWDIIAPKLGAGEKVSRARVLPAYEGVRKGLVRAA